MSPATCYHGRRLPGGAEVIAHDAVSGARVPLVHFIRHSPAGLEWGYGGSGPADLARSLLIDVLGPAALCPGCDGRRLVAWLGPEATDVPEPYDPRKHAGLDRDLITACLCDDGIRNLPYQDFKFEVIARLEGDHWRITRADVLRWLLRHYQETPPWLLAAIGVEDRALPAFLVRPALELGPPP